MRIEHIALWTPDLERMRWFYETYFAAQAGPAYFNPVKSFRSYFLSFAGGARLELMTRPGSAQTRDEETGYAHLALSTGSKEAVDALTERLRRDGFAVLDGPRYTGDGYYESKIADPDGNPIEITI